MKFKKEDLIEGIYGHEEQVTVLDEIISQSRWSIHHRRVFSFNGKFYETKYSVGATEYQEERPYSDEDDEIECKEVFPKEKIIIVYE